MANPWDEILARDLGDTGPDTNALVSGQAPDEQTLSREINPWDDVIARDLGDYDAQVEAIEPQPESEPGYLGNLGRGIAERGADLLGNLAGFAQTTGQHVEDAAGVLDWLPQLGGIHYGPEGFSYLNAEEWQQYNQEGGALLLRDFQQEWEGKDFGFTSNAEQNWENLKNNPSILKKAQSLAAFGLEVGAISLADMAAAVVTPAPYWASRSEEIAQDRAVSNGRPGNPSPNDLAVGAGTAAVITAMERFGAEQVFSAFIKGGSTMRKILRAGVGEAGTEFVQEQLEYGAETLGTEAGKDLTTEEYAMASLERGAQGAVGGGTAGTVLGVPGALMSREAEPEIPEADRVMPLEFNKDAIDQALFEEANRDLTRVADQARQEQADAELEQLKVTRGWIDLQEKPFKTPVHAETELFQYELENGPAGFRIVQDPRDGQWYVRTFEDAQLLEALAATEVQEGEVITPGQPAPTTEGIEVGEEIDITEPGPTTEGIEAEEVGEQIEMKRGPIYEKRDRERGEVPTQREWEGATQQEAEQDVIDQVFDNGAQAKLAADNLKKTFPQSTVEPIRTTDGEWRVKKRGAASLEKIRAKRAAVDWEPTEGEIEVTEGEQIDIGEPSPTAEGVEAEEIPTRGVGEIPEGIEVEELEAEEITLGRKIYTDQPPKKPPDDEGPGGAPPPAGPAAGPGRPQIEAEADDLDNMDDEMLEGEIAEVDARLATFPEDIDTTAPDAADMLDEIHNLRVRKRTMQDMIYMAGSTEEVEERRSELWEESHRHNAGAKRYDTIEEMEDKIGEAKETARTERIAQAEAEGGQTQESSVTAKEIPVIFMDDDSYDDALAAAEARGEIIIRGIPGEFEIAGEQIVRRRGAQEEVDERDAEEEEAELDTKGYPAEKIPPTEVMETAFRELGRAKVLEAIEAKIQDENYTRWEPTTRVAQRVAESVSLNMLSQSDPKKWPQPNKHGVYNDEDAEHIEFPAKKTHQYKAEMDVLEAYEGMWIVGTSTWIDQGGTSSGISSGSNGISATREEAINNVLRGWKERYGDTEHRGHAAFKKWLDETMQDTRSAHVSQPEWDARNDPELLKKLKKVASEMGELSMDELAEVAREGNYPRSGPHGNVRDNRGAIIQETQRRTAAFLKRGTKNITEFETKDKEGRAMAVKSEHTGKNNLDETYQISIRAPLRDNVSKKWIDLPPVTFEGHPVRTTLKFRIEDYAKHHSRYLWDSPNGRAKNPIPPWTEPGPQAFVKAHQANPKFYEDNGDLPYYPTPQTEEEKAASAKLQKTADRALGRKTEAAAQEGPYDPDPDWPWAVLGHPTEDDKAGVLWAFGDTREEAENDFSENLMDKHQDIIDAEKDIVYVQIPPETDYDYYDGNAREFYTDFYAGELKEERAFGEPKGATFAGARPAATGEHPRVPGRMDTETLEDGTVYDLSKSAETQIATTVPTYDKVKDQYFASLDNGDILDYGAGKGLASQKHGFESLEPYPRGWSPMYQSTYDIRRQYDGVIMNNILNVLPKHTRRAVLWDAAEKTRPGGQIFVNVRSRGDVIKTKHQKVINKRNAEILTSRGTYQKGFTFGELVTFIGQELGPDYTVTKADPGSVAVIITKSRKLPPMWDGGGVKEPGEQGYLPGMEPTQTEKTDYEAQHRADLFVESNPHFTGLRLSHKPGDTRNGKKVPHYYGEILNTEDADGMPADVILSANHDPKVVSPIYIVNVVDPKTGEFAQHKTMAGFNDILEAEQGYIDQFGGDERFGDISAITPELYRAWINNPEQLKKEFNPETFRGEMNRGADPGKPVAGDNILTAKYLAEEGDIVNISPWLLADGSVVESGADHIGYALERGIGEDPGMGRETAVVSMFQQVGGAIRSAFFWDVTSEENVAWLHLHTDQTLTPAQIRMLEDFFRESRRIKRRPVILMGQTSDGNNPQVVEVNSIAELKRLNSGVAEPKPGYGEDPNEKAKRNREDLAWEPVPEPPPPPAEVGPPPPIPPKGEPSPEAAWEPVPERERPPEVDVDVVLNASVSDPTALTNIPITETVDGTRYTHNAKWWKDAYDERLVNLNKLRGCGR